MKAAIEDELIAAVVANAQSSSGDPTTEERETDGEHMNIVEVDCTADIQKIAGGPGEAMMGPKSGDIRERGEGAIRGSGRGRGRGRGRGQAAIASARALAPSRTRTREVRPTQRMDA